MPACSALNCKYKHINKSKSGKTVHAFPFSRPGVLAKWIINVRRNNWKPSKRSVLCSDHFEEDCFIRSGVYVKLKPDAVPTKFNFPPNLMIKKCKERKRPSRHISETEIDSKENAAVVQNSRNCQTSSDHTYNESPAEIKFKLEVEIKQNSLYQKKLKVKQQHIMRLLKKVHSMSELVDHLKKKQLVGENAAHTLKKELFRSITGTVNQNVQEESDEIDHFEEDCFIGNVVHLKLEPDAVPTKYDFPPNLNKTSNDHTYNENPRELKHKLEEEIKQNSLYQKRLKVKQQRIRRLLKKVHSISELVDHLKQKQLVGEDAAHILEKELFRSTTRTRTVNQNVQEEIDQLEYFEKDCFIRDGVYVKLELTESDDEKDQVSEFLI